jgi:hypothetical protein
MFPPSGTETAADVPLMFPPGGTEIAADAPLMFPPDGTEIAAGALLMFPPPVAGGGVGWGRYEDALRLGNWLTLTLRKEQGR